jgi:hypothetical protein
MKPMPSSFSSLMRRACSGVTRRRTYTNARLAEGGRRAPRGLERHNRPAPGTTATPLWHPRSRSARRTRVAVDAVGEHAAVAIEDVASLCGDLIYARTGWRPDLEILVLVHLEADEPSLNARRPDEKDHGAEHETAPDRGAPAIGRLFAQAISPAPSRRRKTPAGPTAPGVR